MAWEVTIIDEYRPSSSPKYSKHIEYTHEATEDATFRPTDFTDILSNELILICIASYLPVSTLLALAATSKSVCHTLQTTPGVWRTIDLSDLYRSPADEIVKFLRQDYILRDCRHLVLDGLNVDHTLLDELLLREMPLLQSISLQSCPNLNGDQLIKFIEYIRRPIAPRPLSLKYIRLLGAPAFALNEPSYVAPIIVTVAGDEIATDLHAIQCFGKDHIDKDIQQGRWHLKVSYPNHPCAVCDSAQRVCMKCHVKKTCVGCLSFYCDTCEPFPQVLPPL